MKARRLPDTAVPGVTVPRHEVLSVRWAILADTDAILQIERESYRQPWSQDEYLAVARERNSVVLVAEHQGRIVGFMVYLLHYNCFEILNLAVAVQSRETEVGSVLFDAVVRRLDCQRRFITADVNEANLTGQLFFRSVGMRCVQVSHDHHGSGQTAYLFRYESL